MVQYLQDQTHLTHNFRKIPKKQFQVVEPKTTWGYHNIIYTGPGVTAQNTILQEIQPFSENALRSINRKFRKSCQIEGKFIMIEIAILVKGMVWDWWTASKAKLCATRSHFIPWTCLTPCDMWSCEATVTCGRMYCHSRDTFLKVRRSRLNPKILWKNTVVIMDASINRTEIMIACVCSLKI